MFRRIGLLFGLLLLSLLVPFILAGSAQYLPKTSTVFAAEKFGRLLDLSWFDSAQTHPDITYNPVADEFLVVWQSDGDNGLMRIFAARVNHSGEILAEFVLIGTHRRIQPAVAFDPTLDRYLITWSEDVADDGSDWDIYGAFLTYRHNDTYVNATPPFLIADFSANQYESDLLYNPQESEFLIAWTNYPQSIPPYISVQPIQNDGTVLINQRTTIADLAMLDGYFLPDLAYNATANEYLLVYERFHNMQGDIDAQRLDKNGAPHGSVIGVTARASEEEHPAVAYCPQSNLFFVTWQDYPQGKMDNDIYGRYVSAAGVVGASGAVSALNGLDEIDPDVACAPRGESFLVVWVQQTTSNGPNATFGRELASNFSLQPTLEIAPPAPSATGGNQQPEIAGGGVGYLTVWEHQLSGQLNRIYGQILQEESVYLPLLIRQ